MSLSQHVVTGPIPVIYPALFTPKAFGDSQERRYRVGCLISKTNIKELNRIKDAIQKTYEQGETKLKGQDAVCPPLTAIKNPLHDCDAEKPGSPIYAGHFFLTATSRADSKPGVFGPGNVRISNPEEIYAGAVCRVSMDFFAYNRDGRRGIGCALVNVKKIKDGERIGGRPTAQDDFGDDEQGGVF